jgi:hypothetical protein
VGRGAARSLLLAAGVGIALGALVAPAGASGGDVNLNGRFRVHEVNLSVVQTVEAYVGQRFTLTWTLTPTCAAGACSTLLVSSSGLRIHLAPSGLGYAGSTTSLENCLNFAPPYSVVAINGLRQTASVRLVPSDVRQGAAHRLTGTLTYRATPTAAGRAVNCYPGSSVRSVTATALAGTVRAATSTTTTTVAPPTTTVPRGHASAAAAHRSTIASSLVPLQHAFPINRTFWLDALLALLAMLLITFPAQVFNRTLDENYEEIRTIAAQRMPQVTRVVRWSRRVVRTSPVVAFVGVLLLGSFIGCFNDPTFGLNAASAETFVAVILTFLLDVAIAGGVGWAYRRGRALDRGTFLHAIPAGLIVAVTCVVVSRLSGFKPGYLYGVIAGVAFVTAMGKREKGHEVALSSLATLVVGFTAWAIWSYALHAPPAHPSPVRLVLDTMLAALFVSGVVNTVISLAPIESLAGVALYRWHRGAWGVIFAIATFLLLVVMLLPAARHARSSTAPLAVTIGLFGAFALVSISFNRYFAARHRRAATVAGQSTTGVLVRPAASADPVVPEPVSMIESSTDLPRTNPEADS